MYVHFLYNQLKSVFCFMIHCLCLYKTLGAGEVIIVLSVLEYKQTRLFPINIHVPRYTWQLEVFVLIVLICIQSMHCLWLPVSQYCMALDWNGLNCVDQFTWVCVVGRCIWCDDCRDRWCCMCASLWCFTILMYDCRNCDVYMGRFC